MKKRVRKFIEEKHLLAQGERVLVGVSGGADSVCLLLLLRELRKEQVMLLHAVHVHHGIRGAEADADLKFVRELCHEWEIPLSVQYADVPALAAEQHMSLEEAGRKVRYELFEKVAMEIGAHAVCVAHHRDDLVETMLFRMLRGTGVRGLLGIPAKSTPFSNPRLRLIRPLLCVTRQEIEEYLREAGVSYCTDSTNADNQYQRNYLRNVVLPSFSQVNARAEEHIASLAERLEPLVELLDRHLATAIPQCISPEGLDVRHTLRLTKAVRREVLLYYVKTQAGTAKDITDQHISALEELLQGDVSKEIRLPYGLTFVRGYTHIYCKTADEESFRAGCAREIREFPVKMQLSDGSLLEFSLLEYKKTFTIPKNKCTKWLDYDKIVGSISVRYRRGGDYLVISPAGQRQLLQDTLVNLKIPKEQRDTMELVTCESEILWIPGYRGSEAYRVSQDTKNILQMRWSSATGSEDGAGEVGVL